MERSKSELEKIKSELSSLQTRKLDREAMDLEALKAKRLYQMALDQEISRIDKNPQLAAAPARAAGKSLGLQIRGPPLPPLTGGIKEQPVE